LKEKKDRAPFGFMIICGLRKTADFEQSIEQKYYIQILRGAVKKETVVLSLVFLV